jgi:hypothetical protein
LLAKFGAKYLKNRETARFSKNLASDKMPKIEKKEKL